MNVSTTDAGNNGLLAITDHFPKFAGALLCSHDRYDTVANAQHLLSKCMARHGTPHQMQSSTLGHSRGNGLVERQSRTLLTLLRVYNARKVQSWDQHHDEVLGAYNATHQATTGFSPYILTHGNEKSNEQFVQHLIAQ